MRFSPLQVNCPTCGSQDVTYTCEPECCFNHVCNACHSSFMLGTEKLGRELPEAERAGLPSEGPEDSLAPTVGCDRCESTAVYQLEQEFGGATHVCGACSALLKVTIGDVAQN